MKAELVILYKLAMGKYIHTWGSPIPYLVNIPADAQAWGVPCTLEYKFHQSRGIHLSVELRSHP